MFVFSGVVCVCAGGEGPRRVARRALTPACVCTYTHHTHTREKLVKNFTQTIPAETRGRVSYTGVKTSHTRASGV